MEDNKATGRSAWVRLPGPAGWMVTPLARRGHHALAFTLVCSVLVAGAEIAACALMSLAASAVLPWPLALPTAFAGRLLAVLATLGACALLITAPAWITAGILEKRLWPRSTTAPEPAAASRPGDRSPAGRRGRRPCRIRRGTSK